LKRGDVIAVCMENHPRYLEISWANQRSGTYLVCISSKATAAEAEYIIEDCGAKLFITSPHMNELAQQLAPRLPGRMLYMVGDAGAAVSIVGARARSDADDADRGPERRR
jgi:long-chain acyl-CoA synthetase